MTNKNIERSILSLSLARSIPFLCYLNLNIQHITKQEHFHSFLVLYMFISSFLLTVLKRWILLRFFFLLMAGIFSWTLLHTWNTEIRYKLLLELWLKSFSSFMGFSSFETFILVVALRSDKIMNWYSMFSLNMLSSVFVVPRGSRWYLER